MGTATTTRVPSPHHIRPRPYGNNGTFLKLSILGVHYRAFDKVVIFLTVT